MDKQLVLTTDDSEVLKRHGLFKIDNAWIKGQLYFINGRLLTAANIHYTSKDLITLYNLTNAGILALREDKQ